MSDPIDPNSPHNFCVGDAGDPNFSFTYSRTVNVPASGCVSYDNTATFTTNDTSATGSDKVTVQVCAAVNGKTQGFWGNKNGQALLVANDAFSPAKAVELGISGLCYVKVDSQAKSQQILPNTKDGIGLTGCSGLLDNGINTGSFNNLLSQTLALSYNILYRGGYAGQTLGDLGCAGVGPLTSSSTVEQARAYANYLIGNAKKNAGDVITQSQIGDMNGLLGNCLNAEA